MSVMSMPVLPLPVKPVPVARVRCRSAGHPAAGAPSATAVSLVQQVKRGLAEVEWEANPAEKFVKAYLCALRAAAAMLALRGRPHRGRSRPTSAWVLLTVVAPELREWAAFFESFSATCAAINAGITRVITQRSADDLVRQAVQFLQLVELAVRGAHAP